MTPNEQPETGLAVGRFALGVVAVATGAAAFAIAFRWTLHQIYHVLYGASDVLAAFRKLPLGLRVAVPAAGGLLVGLLLRLLARKGGHTVGAVMEAVALGRLNLSLPQTLVRALGSMLAIACGASVGREGPLIGVGGSLGSALGNLLGVGERRERVLIAAGAASGFAAAYNTPLAAVLFVLEIVTGIAALDAVLPTLLATTLATALTRAAIGGGPIYGERVFTISSPAEYLFHAGLGLLGGLLGTGFMLLLERARLRCDRTRLPQPWLALAGGLVVGLIAAFVPEVVGNGYEPLAALLGGGLSFSLVVALLLAKPFATVSSVATGSPGGVFTPSLLLGGTLGLLVGQLATALLGARAVGPAGGYALVGMAALVAATTRAPVMAAVLVFEVSGDYAIVLPLLLSTALATIVSRKLHRDSVYGSELRRRWEMTLEGRDIEKTGTLKMPPVR